MKETTVRNYEPDGDVAVDEGDSGGAYDNSYWSGEDSADGGEDGDNGVTPTANSAENFALRKEEASRFQDAIKGYAKSCVANEKKCGEAASAVTTDVSSMETLRRTMQKEHDDRKTAATTRVGRTQVSESYGKILFAATNAEDFLRHSLTALSTASEMLALTQQMVEVIRDSMGEHVMPIKINGDLKKISTGVKKLNNACKVKRTILKNFEDLTSISQKVNILDKYITEQAASIDIASPCV